jgi:hypothetical protein
LTSSVSEAASLEKRSQRASRSKLRTPLKALADVIHPFPAFNRVLGASLEELAAKALLQHVAQS